MKLLSLEFENKTEEWKLEKTQFGDLTLLVGVSGAGKTQILKAITTVQQIAFGPSLHEISWDVVFRLNGDTEYQWIGEFKKYPVIEPTLNPIHEHSMVLTTERLIKNGYELLKKETDTITFKQQKSTFAVSPYESALHVVSEAEIQKIQKAWALIDNSHQNWFPIKSQWETIDVLEQLLESYQTLESIQESNLPIVAKLALAFKNQPGTFQTIKERFVEVFQQVTEMRFQPLASTRFPHLEFSPLLEIQVAPASKWIDYFQISSGMRQTLIHIAKMLLSPNGTIFLIDEFENSLGINCIDEVTDSVLNESGRLQFIITSHHPYVINNIGFEFWKIVTRKGGVISTHDASELIQAKSKHDRFLQLFNYEKYQHGVDAA
ncbi:MAG: ATP-binding protein [Blastocatellia bacterium]|nr:ATP-binding protein [Blastocatellia bacterium]